MKKSQLSISQPTILGWPFLIGALVFLAYLVVSLVSPPRTVNAQGGLLTVTTAAEVTGAAAAVQVSSSGTALWIQVIAPSSNSAVIRCGDSNVSATRGLPIGAGGGYMFPQVSPDPRQSVNQRYYSLDSVYCYIGTGDKANFLWAK